MASIILELLTMCYPVIGAAILHMVVVKLNLFKTLKYPMDHFKSFRGKRIFGNNKTYRGLVVMVVLSIMFTYLHHYLSGDSQYNLLDYSRYSIPFYSVLFGLGYILGELPNSFFKRQINVEPGSADGFWLHIIDQVDSVSFIMLILIPFSNYTWTHFFVGVVFFGVVHLAINYILFIIGVRKTSI